LNFSEAKTMIEELTGYKILEGFRDKKPRDIEAFIEAIVRVSEISINYNIMEMDINPFILLEKGKGGIAVDARIIL